MYKMGFTDILRRIAIKKDENAFDVADREATRIKTQERVQARQIKKQEAIQGKVDRLKQNRLKLEKEVTIIRAERGEKQKIKALQREKYKPVLDFAQKIRTGIKTQITKSIKKKKAKGKGIKINTTYYGGASNSPFGNEEINSPFAPRK